jgi:adenine-specific DNA-methyltransferase
MRAMRNWRAMIDTQAIDERREAVARATPSKHKSQFGQFMTPGVIANFMAAMFGPLGQKDIRLLDAGAGIGCLTAAVAFRAVREKAKSLECEAWEIDPKLQSALRDTLDDCGALAKSVGTKFRGDIQTEDFILAFADLFARTKMVAPTHAILNPPYKKINSDSAHRLALRDLGVETSNLYSAFVSLALMSMADGGELVAITPRSFCNGPYFKPFRALLLDRAALVQIHLFESRTQAFSGDEVLQENVIFHLVKGRPQHSVLVSTSTDATFSDVVTRTTSFDEIVSPIDAEKIFHLGTTDSCLATANASGKYCHRLQDLGIAVSTGPVVDFRLREHLRGHLRGHLREQASDAKLEDCAPLIYAHHFAKGLVVHPLMDTKKPNFIAINEATKKWLMPNAHYALVRRLSSKEENRRIVPAVFELQLDGGDWVGFENHLNVFHSAKQGLKPSVAKGLAIYLGSTFADQWLRRFSGHTQVNAGDLRALRYPDLSTLEAWGRQVRDQLPSQVEIDQLVGGVHAED